MAANQSLAGGWVLFALAGRKFGGTDLRARPENIVFGGQVIDGILRCAGQRVVGCAHIGELGLAVAERALRRQRDRVQQTEHDGDGHVGGVGVPQAVAQTVEAAAVSGLGHWCPRRGWRCRRSAGWRGGGVRGVRRTADLERTEAGGEIAQLVIGEALVAEHDHRVGIDGGLNSADGIGIQGPGQVEESGLGGDSRRAVPASE